MLRHTLRSLPLLPLILGAAAFGQASSNIAERITKEVRHELVMLPYYGVFDVLSYKVDGDTVTLIGQVTRPTLKSDAENVVKKIEGVEHVNNEIEVLPPLPNDDRIRRTVFRAVYGNPTLERYALQAVPPHSHHREEWKRDAGWGGGQRR